MQNPIKSLISSRVVKSKIGKVLKSFGINLCILIWDVSLKSIDSFWPSHQWILQKIESRLQKLCLRLLASKDYLLVSRPLSLYSVRSVVPKVVDHWLTWHLKIWQVSSLTLEMVWHMCSQLLMALLLVVACNIFHLQVEISQNSLDKNCLIEKKECQEKTLLKLQEPLRKSMDMSVKI